MVYFSFQHNSKQATTSVMTQPACRTFLPGHVVAIICSITIQLSNIARTFNMEQYEHSIIKIGIIALLGITFLSYPLLGYIADACLTRYRTLKMFIYIRDSWMHYVSFIHFCKSDRKRSIFNDNKGYIFSLISGIPLIALITTGVGLFEANTLTHVVFTLCCTIIARLCHVSQEACFCQSIILVIYSYSLLIKVMYCSKIV